jgi:hypothetical protein
MHRLIHSAAAAALAAAPLALHAQATGRGFESRSTSGALIATGDQRDILKDAFFTGGQLAYRVHKNVTVVGAFGYSPGTTRTDEKLNVYQYDLGVEGRLPGLVGLGSWAISPYGTLGAGGRTYDYKHAGGTETNFVGFAGAGADVGPRGARWGVRVGARDYVSSFRGLRGELAEREARNDVAITAGLTMNFGGR